jgi:hypothetical protein
VAVYGPAQPDHKENFLAELVRMGSQENLPFIMGGDFNILRHPSEKNNANYNARCPFLFNAVIDGLNLRELKMTERNFTWANNLASPTFEKLDRILITTEWEEIFPLSTIRALTREIFDHQYRETIYFPRFFKFLDTEEYNSYIFLGTKIKERNWNRRI